MDNRRAQRSFEPTTSAPASSRRFLREFLDACDADDLAPTAELLTTELVTNVVRHAVTPLTVDLAWNDPTLRVEVRDGSSIVPAVSELPAVNAGYGLHLVRNLARDWGVKHKRRRQGGVDSAGSPVSSALGVNRGQGEAGGGMKDISARSAPASGR